MSPSRKKQVSFLDELFGLLVILPTWVGPIAVAMTYAAFRWGIPIASKTLPSDNPVADKLYPIAQDVCVRIAPWMAGLVFVVWVVAEFRKRSARKRLDTQTGIESIRELSWTEFESLLAEAFRRQGYSVEQTGGSAPDGGIDLKLGKADAVSLVQCKHWKARKVNVKIARELLGVVTSEGAKEGVLVSSGEFTSDAIEFARNTPLTLIDGGQLERMIRDVQSSSVGPNLAPAQKNLQPASPTCPVCESPMLLRTAKRGDAAGSKFWGCPRYPQCRGTRELVV